MQFLVIFLVSALAVSNAEDCSEQRAEACVDSLLSSLLGDSTEEEVCKELDTSINCLKDAVEECLGEENDDEEVKEGLEQLEKLLNENCKSGDGEDDEDEEDKKMQQCFEENEDYVFECIYEGTAQALEHLMDKEDADENTLQCTMYGMMAGCFVDRIQEKCGEKAASIAQKEMADLPEEIKEACEASGGVEAHSFQLLDKKKRK